MDACFFDTTPVEAAVFLGGMLVLRNCLFAGAVPSWFGPGSVMTEGVQRGNTATRVVFSTASLLETCGGIAGLASPSPAQPATPSRGLSAGATAGVVTGVLVVVFVVALIVVLVLFFKFKKSGSYKRLQQGIQVAE